jgi:nitrite reductase/ring-hydroxylating ferredoxin subunit
VIGQEADIHAQAQGREPEHPSELAGTEHADAEIAGRGAHGRKLVGYRDAWTDASLDVGLSGAPASPDEHAAALRSVCVIEIPITGLSTLALGEAIKFSFEREGEAEEGFVLAHESGLHAYANRCPHWSVDLDMGEGRFYSGLSDRIFCSNHGALFVPATGYCDAGPCRGLRLERFELEVEGDAGIVRVPEQRPGWR